MRKVLSVGILFLLITAGVAERSTSEEAKRPPIRVRFVPVKESESPLPASLNPILLKVERDTKNWPPDAKAEGRVEILLRLPIGVKLEGEDWTPAPLF